MSGHDFTAGPYAFRRATLADLPLIRRWLATPEAARWWIDADGAPEGFDEGYLTDPDLVVRIVAFEGRPFAYVQDYAVHAEPGHHFEALPPGSRGMDTFIGEPEMIGVGHGSAIVRILAERLRAEGAPVVGIDPHPANLRARRAYEKAGFRGGREVNTEWGPSVLMTFGCEGP